MNSAPTALHIKRVAITQPINLVTVFFLVSLRHLSIPNQYGREVAKRWHRAISWMNFEILNVSDYEIGQKSSTSRCRNEYTNREEEEKKLLNMLYSNEFFWLVSFCFDETSLSSLCVCVCFWWFFLYQHSQKTAAITGYQFEQISIHLSTVYLILSVFSDSLAQTKSIRKRKGRKKK